MAISRKVEHYRDLPFFTEKVITSDKETSSGVYRHIHGESFEIGGLQIQANFRWSVNMMVGIGVDRRIPAVAITTDGFQTGKLSDFLEQDYYILEERFNRNGMEYVPGTRVLFRIGIPHWGEYFSFVNWVNVEEPTSVNLWKRRSEISKELYYVTVKPDQDLLHSLRGHLRISRLRHP